LGLCMAEGLAEAGGKVYCLDRTPEAPQTFLDAQKRLKGQLEYHKVDVTNDQEMRQCIQGIAAERQRLDGLIAGT
jgi:D-arabinitol 2-dehydrogenase